MPTEAAPFWSAFLTLARDRPHESISMGMGGGLSLPRPVPMEAIRREGSRLGYTGEGLEDFVSIVARIDDSYVESEVRRIADEAKAASQRSRSKR